MNETVTILEPAPTKVDFRAVFHSLVPRIEETYKIKVRVGPVEGSYTGQFDGLEIWVDLDKNSEEAVFILVHLFGHTVQWNLNEKQRLLGLAVTGVKIEDLPRLHAYEREASQYGLKLLEEVGEFSLARWLSDCFGADWKFLDRFYRTGEKVRYEITAGADEPLLTSKPIPSFVPQRWPPRLLLTTPPCEETNRNLLPAPRMESRLQAASPPNHNPHRVNK